MIGKHCPIFAVNREPIRKLPIQMFKTRIWFLPLSSCFVKV
ncbi:hypothetical protein MANES_08G172311v8 [Manihot esculenta]|uniref:Uncharacterized protein n=1 Tax=Manihot esculenta TaxID=3983 RepID=A0ACB7HC34_MANES|nr:hypothetical protein MANES_08G172311v8 [Manihot esculenta]